MVYAGGGTTHDLATLWCWTTTPPGDTFYWMDGVVTTAYMNTRQRETREIPRYEVKLVEDKKFYADKISEQRAAMIHGGRHTCLVPFAVEDSGKLGAHAQTFLRSLAERVVRKRWRSRAHARGPGGTVLRSDGATHVSL